MGEWSSETEREEVGGIGRVGEERLLLLLLLFFFFNDPATTEIYTE